MFITGTFIGNNCWDEWTSYFESKGYHCITPSWPHKDAGTEELRNRHPDAAIASNRLTGLTDYFAAIVKALPAKPILIGHSLGGLVVQLLLQRGLGTAGVAVHSFPPRGVCTSRVSFLKAVWSAISFASSVQLSYMISFRKWKRAITNGLTCKQQKQLFYNYAIPESKLIVRDVFRSAAKIDFGKPHAPLLFTSGGKDKMVPSSLNYDNYNKYKTTDFITDYREFKDHNHLVFDQPSCGAEADFILYWLQGLN